MLDVLGLSTVEGSTERLRFMVGELVSPRKSNGSSVPCVRGALGPGSISESEREEKNLRPQALSRLALTSTPLFSE